ncbi:DNA/RNA nuclease SfsA [Alteromonas sp. ASW11-36]|uniref:Sugar fermentation stimulation protein homolog n=1 Tax=Alteromonas arenosi TaxID=3055817 RepID=A0ABT7SYM2_9ALTE|nr:DNA/RNA nuclease SfsA [Alteromonas sp. ASW11-36]MDM7861291.1 DNA/RNA nuclease SfsA [Alteromonas sp. ASW11-36]
MDFALPLISGTLIKRYKRFFADVKLDSGEVVTAHCANTGAMTGCAEPGFKVWLSPANNPKRKLQYTWEIAINDDGAKIGVNTNNANKIVAHALHSKHIAEVSEYDHIRPEFKPQGADSRFDFLLQSEGIPDCLLEVKSLTLCEGSTGFFPDAVTTRGAKHCAELANYAQQGYRAILLFCVQHTAVEQVKVAAHVDAKYAEALCQARQQGVEVLAYKCAIEEEKTLINQKLDIVF